MTEDLDLLAAREYIARRDGVIAPSGTRDKFYRWFPAEHEARECCEGIRAPSRQWHDSLLSHCRSLFHVCRLFDADPARVGDLVDAIDGGKLEEFWHKEEMRRAYYDALDAAHEWLRSQGMMR